MVGGQIKHQVVKINLAPHQKGLKKEVIHMKELRMCLLINGGRLFQKKNNEIFITFFYEHLNRNKMYFLILLLPLLILFLIINIIRLIYYYFKIKRLKKEFREKFGHTDYYGENNRNYYY